MNKLVIIIGIAFLLIGIIYIDAIMWWPVSPNMEMEFRTSNAKGLIDGRGLYTFYSKSSEIKEILVPEQKKGAKVYSIEFPLNTKDGGIVYGMYYFYGKLDNNSSLLYQAFRGSYISRWLLIDVIPSTIEAVMQQEVGQTSYAAFLMSQNNPTSSIKEKAYKKISPLLQLARIQPVTMTILVYAQ